MQSIASMTAKHFPIAPPGVVSLFDISDWKVHVGWLEVEVGPPIVTRGGGRTTSLRRQAAGNNHDLNHKV